MLKTSIGFSMPNINGYKQYMYNIQRFSLNITLGYNINAFMNDGSWMMDVIRAKLFMAEKDQI